MRASSVICLVGMPGSGKSTVGPLLADRLGMRFVDLDEMVSAAAGQDVAQIFASEGEAGFRRRELTALSELVAADDRVVVATGGGIVTTPQARAELGRVTCVWLDAPLGTLLARLRDEASTRPLLAADPEGALRRLHEERAALYRDVADHAVETDGLDPEDVAARLADLVMEVAG